MYLIVFGSLVGYSSYIYALSKLPVSKFSMYAYINPVIAVILGWLILDERFDWVMVTSTVVILFGVVLVKTAPTVQPKPEPAKNEPLNPETLKGCKQVIKSGSCN